MLLPLLTLTSVLAAQPAVGDAVPDFTVKDIDGVELQLSADMFQTPNPAEERVAVGVQVPAEFSHSK